MNKKPDISILIPAYNEEKAINKVIEDLKRELAKLDLGYEIIVINDCSTDKTKEILEKISEIKAVHHHNNRGYGAALKTGIENAKFNKLLFFDADGQHNAEHISEMIKYSDEFDMVSGARIGYKGPFIRQPGKKILHWLINYLTKQDVPDFNCGFRIVKKEQISKFTYLLCDGFSFSTTTTLLFISEGLSIKYLPIGVKKREGKSMVKPKDAFDTLILILRTIVLSVPLKIFLPISLLLFLVAVLTAIYDVFSPSFNITGITILLFISSLVIFFFGLVADQISMVRKEMRWDRMK